MATKQASIETESTYQGRPNQLIRYSEKTKKWYHHNADYYVRNSWSLSPSRGTPVNQMQTLYEVYNNKFPLAWFDHIIDPLKAKKPQHKRFPAKIRPINILRTSIDLLINELAQRPFVVQVINQGETAYNDYQEKLQQAVVRNLTDHFMMEVQMAAQEQGGVEGIPPPQEQEIPIPAKVQERFQATYKDNQAIAAQRWLSRTLDDVRFFNKRERMMKDYLIAGYTHSYKNIVHGKMVYDNIPPLELRYAKSPELTFIKDAAWAVRRYYLTTADVVERFHATLSKESVQKIYNRTGQGIDIPFTGGAFYNYLKDQILESQDLVAVYHTVWRGKKIVKVLTYPDPTTGMMEQMEVDEDYPVNKALGETATEHYRDEVYECYRILEDIYAEEGPTVVQNGNLPYNGRAFSDTHAENISILSIGLPFQMMVMIINWTMERLIAKSKGKILLIDINAIPDHGDWDEEKFFYYADALGYGLLDRDKRKVDKSWNQYQVLDLSLYEQIKQLIDLQNHFRQMWDDVLGITMPRKGQTYASSSPTNNERSLFQSNVITDNIFTGFEGFIAEDFNDMLEYSKILNSEGTKSLFTSDMFDVELLNLDPVAYCNAMLGIIVKTSAKEQKKLDELKMYMQELIQNGVKPSTLMEIIVSENVAELKMKLKEIERIQAAAEAAGAESEQEAAAAAEERAHQFKIFENQLEMERIDKEWDRRDQNTMIKGEYDIVSFTKSEDNNMDSVPDATAIAERVMDRFKIMAEDRKHLEQNETKNKEIMSKEKIAADKNATDIRREEIRAKTALKNKTAGEK